MFNIDKRIIGVVISTAIGFTLLLDDTYYAWLLLMFSFFIGLLSAGLMISALYLGKKAFQWGLIGFLPLLIFFGIAALQRLIN
jgi:hypothetical protein